MADATYDPDDYWGMAVNLLTGFPMPSRHSLFEKVTSGEHGIPLFRINGISHWPIRGVTAADIGYWGWQRFGADYNIPFYETRQGNGAHDTVRMRSVNIIFLGSEGVAPGQANLLDGGQTMSGGQSGHEDNVEWDRGSMANYISGPKVALDALLNPPYTTRDVSFNGAGVADANAVDLNSFRNTAMAFDRVAGFFRGRSVVLEQWDKALGEGRSAWQGQAADMFWSLINQIRRNYDGYVQQMGGRQYTSQYSLIDGYTPVSKTGEGVALAQSRLVAHAGTLREAWNTWADGYHDPYRILLQLLDEVAEWTVRNNLTQVLKRTDGNDDNLGGLTAHDFHEGYFTTPAFMQDHPQYGFLGWPSSWKKVGEEAVRRWNARVEEMLGHVASQVIADLKNNWIDASRVMDHPIESVATKTLDQIYQEEQTDAATAAAQEQADALNDGFAALNDNFAGFGGALNDGLTQLGDSVGDGLNGMGDDFNAGLDAFGNALGGGGGFTSPLNDGSGLGGLDSGSGTALDGLGGGGGFTSPLNDGSGLGGLDSGSGSPLDGLSGGSDFTSPLDDIDAGSGLPDGVAGGGGTPLDGIDAGGPPVPLNPSGLPLLPPGGESLPGTAAPGTQLNPDGTLTTTYPDGSSVALNPGLGTAVTTRPDGSTVTTDLGDGPLVNPDGSVTVANPDGTVTTTHPDGTVTVLNPDTGTLTSLNADGTLGTTYPDGTTIAVDPDTGFATTTAPDGTTSTTDLGNGALQAPDGSTIALNSDTGALTTTHPDGTTVTLDPATGNLVTERPDGTVTTLNPDTATLTTQHPDGTTETTDLNGPTLPNSDQHVDVPLSPNEDLQLPGGLTTELPHSTAGDGGPGLGTGGSPLNGGLATVGAGSPHEEPYYDEDQDTGLAARGIGSPAAATTAGGTPLNPGLAGTPMMPGMMPPGMMGPGAGGGGKEGGSSERQRNVYSTATGASLASRRGGRPAALDDEDVVITRGRTSTTSGAAYSGRGGAGADRRRTESVNTARDGWRTDDEDVWGTDEGGAPAVIGR
ncbi:AAWKG family protein [Streptomyces sp. NPDC052721]|uniref:AAWKG family protein n=1 Tax=Streptomyces sp. NPDC052721 TaxID=3154955 RepID=UPI003418D79E